MVRDHPGTSIDWRKLEEIIAGAYEREGWPEVVLTPRSGDRGRNVIATKPGIGSIRIIDQVKAYAPDHPVTADEVRAVLGAKRGTFYFFDPNFLLQSDR
ncbi:MAG: restriction endonuclease [Deltaproteobacteria bacterium]|nr:restriction endonuclease [Deltaproteobacteria bacterium]MBI2999097.1 restriction endonuclease [Deltaproteobacteria bacterium]